LDYKKTSVNKNDIRYNFEAEGLKYQAVIWHDTSKHRFGEYEASFDVETQEHAGERQGKDIKHFNNVIYTVSEIVEKEVKANKIKKIKIDGARDEKDSGDSYFQGSLRTKLYLRFLKNRYPSDAITTAGTYIYIDMTKVFPEIFDEEKSSIDKLIDTLVQVSDGDPDRNYIMRGVGGADEESFSFESDLTNKKYNELNLSIDKDPSYGFTVEWEDYASGESSDEYGIKTVGGVIEYLKKTFL